MIVFEGVGVGVGLLLALSHLIERIPVQRGVLLGAAAGLGFGISDVAIKALSGELKAGRPACSCPGARSSCPTAAVFSFFTSARSLQIGVRVAAFALILVGAALIPAPVRAGEALEASASAADPP